MYCSFACVRTCLNTKLCLTPPSWQVALQDTDGRSVSQQLPGFQKSDGSLAYSHQPAPVPVLSQMNPLPIVK